jgi:betaine-aldehyde dehydrogenase
VSELFIGSTWRDAGNGGRRDSINSCDQSLIATFADGPWPHFPAGERAAVLVRVAGLLQRDREDIARTETLDTGKTLVESRIDVDDVIADFRYYADLVTTLTARPVPAGSDTVTSRIEYEPVGVCGLITPWNYPLLQASWKIAPGLAPGNTIVVKPSELTPLTTIALFRLLAEAGVPDGAANLVLGTGPEAGAGLAEHPAVDLVSFTGGLATGRWIARTAADAVKKVCLERGGKNPNIVFADADFDVSVDLALNAAFLHSGQVCSVGTRLLVQTPPTRISSPHWPGARGRSGWATASTRTPRAGRWSRRRSRPRWSATARSASSRAPDCLPGGCRPDEPELAQGFFYLPTVFADCTAEMTPVREETFGPNITAKRFDTEAEAVALGNDTEYGLAGAVWTRDLARGERVARLLRHGTVWINDFGPYLPSAEWSGFKRSGTGRELGPSGLHECCEAKHVYRNHKPVVQNWFARSLVAPS